METNSLKERRTMIIMGCALAVVLVAIFVISLRVPVMQDSTQKYPEVTMSQQSGTDVSDNPLLKYKINVGSASLKVLDTGSDERGNFDYIMNNSSYVNTVIFIKETSSVYDSDEMYGCYAELLGVENADDLKSSSNIISIQSGYLGQMKASYKKLESKKQGDLYFFDISLEEANRHFYYGVKAGDLEYDELQNCVTYVADSITTMKIVTKYGNADLDKMSEKEREDMVYKQEQEKIDAAQRLHDTIDGYATPAAENPDEQPPLEDDVPSDVMPEGYEYKIDVAATMETEEGDTYLRVGLDNAIEKEHSLRLVDPKGNEYEPVARYISEGLGKEIVFFKVCAQRQGVEYVPFTLYSDCGDMWCLEAGDMGPDADVYSIQLPTYEEYFGIE